MFERIYNYGTPWIFVVMGKGESNGCFHECFHWQQVKEIDLSFDISSLSDEIVKCDLADLPSKSLYENLKQWC